MSVPSHSNIFSVIREDYDASLLKLARQYTRTTEKIAARKQHLTFSLRLKRYGLVPRSLWVRPLVNSREGWEIAQRTSRRFLIVRISQNVREIRELKHDKFFQRRQLEFNLQPQHAAALEAFQEVVRNQMTAECKYRQKRKFDTLLERSTDASRPRRLADRWVSNLSSRTLSATEKDVLARGLNFAPAPQKIPVPVIVAAVEGGLSRADPSQAQLARTRIVGCLARARPPPANLSQAECKALKCLREDDSIAIAPADKGNITVVMDRSEYEGKIQTLLDDTGTYRRLTKDPTMREGAAPQPFGHGKV